MEEGANPDVALVPTGSLFGNRLRRVLNRDVLFDIGGFVGLSILVVALSFADYISRQK